MCLLSAVWPALSSKIIEDGAIYNFWRVLVENFFLPVIKPPGTYFNNKSLPSCRSSTLLSPPPAFFCELRWIQFVSIEIRRVREELNRTMFEFFLDKHCIQTYEEPLLSYPDKGFSFFKFLQNAWIGITSWLFLFCKCDKSLLSFVTLGPQSSYYFAATEIIA